MKSYTVEYSAAAEKTLKKMDKHVSGIIYDWIEKNLVGCKNPRRLGRALTGDFSGKWRYRVGDYRIITEIEDDRVIILIVNIGHRSDIYN